MNSRNARSRTQGRDQRSQLPLLDRLIDDAPDALQDPQLSAAETVSLLRRSVRRDLEALLNARRRWRSWPSDYIELAASPVGYGISDFTAGAFNDPLQRDQLRGEIERAIRRFEPRLTGIQVSLIDSNDNLDATLHLRIEAMLRIDPAPEPIAFDTLVDSATAKVQVKPNTDEARPDQGDV
jgi:type VI secretion system protein ImpF